MGEELAAASVAALYLVADEHRSVFAARCLQTLGKLGCGETYAAHTLYALQYDCRHIALCQLSLPWLKVVERQISHVAVGIYGSDDFRIVGGFHCQRRAAMECFLCRKYAFAAGVERSQLHGVLVGLGSAVDQEQLIVVVTASFAQTCGELLLQGVDNRVGVEAQTVELTLESLDVMRMAVADAYHRVTAVEVEIVLTFVVPDGASAAFYYVYVE